MEHSPVTLETVRNIVLATRALPAVPFARVPVTETWTAKRVLDAGVHGVIFPFVSTPALAKVAADACRYPPAGRRGSGAGLATASWPDPDGYADSADCNIVVVAIVEETSALAHVDEIAATPGIDVVFIGTGDLSFSIGSARATGSPARRGSGRQRAARSATARQGRRATGPDARAHAPLHRSGVPLLPGAVGARALRSGRAAVSQPARHRTGQASADSLLMRLFPSSRAIADATSGPGRRAPSSDELGGVQGTQPSNQ